MLFSQLVFPGGHESKLLRDKISIRNSQQSQLKLSSDALCDLIRSRRKQHHSSTLSVTFDWNGVKFWVIGAQKYLTPPSSLSSLSHSDLIQIYHCTHTTKAVPTLTKRNCVQLGTHKSHEETVCKNIYVGHFSSFFLVEKSVNSQYGNPWLE